jgi:RNA-directed DNA polymerase
MYTKCTRCSPLQRSRVTGLWHSVTTRKNNLMRTFFRRIFGRSPKTTPPPASFIPTHAPDTQPDSNAVQVMITPVAALPLQTPEQVEAVAQAVLPGHPAQPVAPSAPDIVLAAPQSPAARPTTVSAPARSPEEMRQRRKHDRRDFGEDLWGISAAQREADINVERLQHLGLPLLYSEEDLADLLGISLSRLRWFTFDKAAETTWHYVRYTVPKRSGGERVILAPKAELKALQRKALSAIIGQAPVALAAHGFVPGKSTATNARAHVGQSVILKLDLQDFFPSITFARVRGMLIALGYPFAVASALALLCTEYDREEFDYTGKRYFISVGPRHLVQGAPTSPALANLVAWRLDRRLAGLAKARGFTYTRYADDLVFSGADPAAVQGLRIMAERIIRDEHFTVNRAKTKVARQSARQVVTGLVVNQQVGTPRALRRRLRAILHNAAQEGLAAQNREGRQDYAAYLQGMIAYVNAGNPAHAVKLRAGLDQVRGKRQEIDGNGN